MNQKRHNRSPSMFPGGLFLGCMIAAVVLSAMPGCRRRGDKKAAGTGTAHEAAAVALERVGRNQGAAAVRKLCGSKGGPSCDCARTAATLALDQDLHREALAVLDQAPASCRLRGLRAEALARARRTEEAEKLAREILKKSPSDKHAVYALAHVHFVRGQAEKATLFARRAAELGRALPAHLLLGLMAFKKKDYAGARASFDVMLKIDPVDAAAHYNLALIHHRQNRYRQAREGYLKALRLNPHLANARYNLVVLTHGAGALDEARHHFNRFRAMVGKSDGRIAALRTLLAKVPPTFKRPTGAMAPARPAPQ